MANHATDPVAAALDAPLGKLVILVLAIFCARYNIVYGMAIVGLAVAYYQDIDIRAGRTAAETEAERLDAIQAAKLAGGGAQPVEEMRDAFFRYDIPTAPEREYDPAPGPVHGPATSVFDAGYKVPPI
jgi:hypothetical protein